VDREPTAFGDAGVTRTFWLIVGGALLIRLWGIHYGLPYVYWIDEYHEVMRAMELGSGEFNFGRTGKGGFYFLLFFEFGLYFVALKLAGVVSTVQEFAEAFVRDPSAFYLMGRVTAAVFGCATVAGAGLVASRAFGTRAGLLAAIFVAVNVLHVDLSHRVGVDVPMTLFATLALCFALRIAKEGLRKDYLLGGLCAALATTTKLPGILVLVPLVIAHAYSAARAEHRPIRWLASSDFWLAAAVFIVVLVLSNPGILLHFDPMSFYSAPGGDAIDGDDIAGEAIAPATRPNLFTYYLGVLLSSMGWPLFVVSLLGAGYAAWKRRPADVLLLSYALVHYLAIAGTSSDVLFYPRYTLPIIVVLAILAGRAVVEVAGTGARSRWTSAVATMMLIAWPLSVAVANTHALTQTDTRTLAKGWFDAHVPAGSKVLIEGGKIAASRLSVPLADTRESLDRRIAYWKLQEPKQAKYLEIMRRVHRGGGYELEFMQIGSIADFSAYRDRGIEYVVVRPDYFIGSRRARGDGSRLIEAMRTDPDVKMIKRFDAGSHGSLGPAIEIYRIDPGITHVR